MAQKRDNMSVQVNIFGMHKAGTSFTMKAISHLCARNRIALASTPFGELPIEALDHWDETGKLSRNQLDSFWAKMPNLHARFLNFSSTDYPSIDIVDTMLKSERLYFYGDSSFDKCIVFYRNASASVYGRYDPTSCLRVIRNPLSIVKSAYFSHLKTHGTVGWSRLRQQREALEGLPIEAGLWLTYEFLMEECFYHFTQGPLRVLRDWPNDVSDTNVIRMEDSTLAPSQFLGTIWRKLGGQLDNYQHVDPEYLTFKYQSGGREVGDIDDDSHLRSGNQDEWRSVLPENLIQRIRRDFEPVLHTFYPDALEDHVEPGYLEATRRKTLLDLEQLHHLKFRRRT